MSEGSNLTSITTVDKNTDLRHSSAAGDLEATEESRKGNPPERKEFAVPALPPFPTRTNKKEDKAPETMLKDKERAVICEDKNPLQQDSENQQGRKRPGSGNAEKEQNDKTEERVSYYLGSFDVVVIKFLLRCLS